MKLKQIIAMSQQDAEKIDPEETWGIISISCLGDEVHLKKGWGAVLSLEFDDITSYRSGYVSFSYEQARQVLDWIDSNVSNGKIDRLAVHCAAGISRSQAVALFVKEYYAKDLKPLRGTEFHNVLVYSMLKYEYQNKCDKDTNESQEQQLREYPHVLGNK